MNSGISSGPHGGDDSPDREKNALYVSTINLFSVYFMAKIDH